MNHRQHKAMRFVKLLWITKEPEGIGFLSNKYIPSRGRDFSACISSRITTVIQVVKYHQINDNWFNEPFAVSLYILLILRHAWLNLWDKHMTTGRINQVTNFLFFFFAQSACTYASSFGFKKKKKKLRSLESHLRSLPNLGQGIKNIKTSSNARHLLGS